ncbi:Ribosome biogenesis protein erb1 [Mortierella alpina]|uniref:Ribosome biogenesis protein ERB1 n=1 Tax=Mortierella alpina TaxID=64518 RepID=A0A9P6JAL8_MORAP|nr:Ribosome biogenesis protein erb1 [Mortierella alpina]
MPSTRPTKKAAAKAAVKAAPAKTSAPAPKSKKRTVAQAQQDQDSDDEFGDVAIDMASDEDEEDMDDGAEEGDSEDEAEEFPEDDAQDMSAADIEEDEDDSEGSYMDGDSLVDSQEEKDDLEEDEDEEGSDFDDLINNEDDIDPNFGHNLNEPMPAESDYHPIKREYPEIDAEYDSDSSTEENGNTVGNIPMEWYDDYPHIGYDIDGKKIMRPATGDELDKFLSTMDDPDSWLSAHNYKQGQDVKLSAEELEIIRRLEGNRIPDADYNPYEDQVEFFSSHTEVMPLSAAPEPKRRFIPSKHEAKRIMKIVRAIREGRIVPRKSGYVPPKPKYYNLWNDSEDKPREEHVMHITAPKMKLPTHDESYNPPAEYLPTEEESKEWNDLDKEDRPKNYLPQKYNALRNVPGYGQFIQERFDRCLDFGYKVGLILPEKIFSPELTLHSEEYLRAGFANAATAEPNPKASWKQPTPAEFEQGIRVWVHLQKAVKQVTWHRKGDYFSTVAPDANNSAVLIHQLTKHQTQQPFKKTKGAVQRVMFHPTKPMFFVATQRYVRQYNLQRQELIKTMMTGVKWISSLDVHPAGDNLIIGSYDKRLCWFDLDLSSKPYKTLRYHQQAIRSVAYHKRYPLFASCADDGNVQIFHGMVYNDLLQNPLIVPVKILKNAHERIDALVKICILQDVPEWPLRLSMTPHPTMSKDDARSPPHTPSHSHPEDAPQEHATNPPQQSTPFPPEFPPGEDAQAHDASNNMALSSRIGSTSSQLASQVNEVRKRTGRRVRPKPLDLDHARLHGHTSQQQQQPLQHPAASEPGSESNQASAASMSASGSGLGLLPTSPTQKEPKHRAKFPLLQIKTDLNRASAARKPAPVTGTATHPSDATNPADVTNNATYTNASNGDQQQQQQHPPERRAPSKWQLGLERMLKKIQRRKRAPSNLTWYAAHSTESYLSGATLDSRPGMSKQEVDTDAYSLHYGSDKPPQWVVNSFQRDDLFFSDDTVELVIALRDYLIKATDSGWDITELKEEIFSTTSPIVNTSAPTSPGGASQDSANSSRRNSRSSMDFDHLSQHAAGRYVEEDEGSYRLLDYFLAILSDIISHDCRYRVQHHRPSRPEWALHSLVLDVLFLLARLLAHDHKAIYDIGMISLSAFPVFKNYALIRLLDLLTDMILPSFATSRTYPHATVAPSSPIASLNPGSPRSPSQIRVQLNNNQTFAIQVHSPTEEMGMLSVPRTSRPTLNSSRMPSSRSSSTSLSRLGPQAPALDTMDSHADSLISLTLLSVLQQISFSKAPLPVAKQLQKSIGRLLRTKPDLSRDLLEVIAIVENEKVMKRALEALWWIEKSSLGHHTLGEKFIPLDYESIVLMRQVQQEWSEPGTTGIGPRAHTEKLETTFSFRKSLDENTISRNDSAIKSNILGSFMVRTKPPPRRSLPWKAASESEAIPMSGTQHQHQQSTLTSAGFDYLADHELYPYMFPALETTDSDPSRVNICERCETAMKGFGLFCYHCRDSIHLECFYSVKKYAGVDCSQLGSALDYVTRQPRNQLIYPDDGNVFESPCNRTYMIRAGHHLQLVNMFSTCLCSCCELPLWGHHHQAYRCQDCEQLMHLDCKGTITDCSVRTQSQVPQQAFPTLITYDGLKQSFREFYQNLISTWEALQASVPGSATLSSPGTPPSAHTKGRYSFEEASCNASVLTLQLELLQKGITRGEIRVSDWTENGQATDPGTLASSDFDLVILHKYFEELVQALLLPGSPTSPSLFLSDFFEDSKPDQLLLFSPGYWSHFASITKTMIAEAEASQWGTNHQFFPPSREGATLQEDDIFAIGLDEAQEKLLADHSVRASNFSLAAIFRFCMRRLGFQSPWSMQQILQEWVKIGLLERLDGEICLFESAIKDPPSMPPPPPLLSPPGSGSFGSSPSGLPTLYTSTYDSTGQSSNTASYRSVHCVFPIVSAIDPTSEVENLIHAIWRCLSSVDLSVNECGFLLLTRRCWPDPFMSDYTTERLVGCIFHWLLLEDDQLFVIHKNYASKGKNIPGVRSGLEEQIARKRIVLGGGAHSGTAGGENVTPGASSTSAHTTSSTTAGSTTTPATAVNSGINANARSSSTHSHLFGAVGSYVKTRKLMSKKFALPWLEHVMEQDPSRYQEMVSRQIRILEREMASENDIDGQSQEEKQASRHTQAERQLEFITKLRQAGFLFSSFPHVLSHWLAGVEGMLDGLDLQSQGFKTLNRLFLKSNSRTGSGLGGVTGHTNPASSGYATPTSASFSKSGASGENEWRSRLRSKLQHGSTIGSIRSQSPTSSESAPESVLDDETPTRGAEKALRWLELMVRSGVQVPTYVFLECCEGLVSLSQSSSPSPSGAQDASGSSNAGLEPFKQAATNEAITPPSLSPWESSSVLEHPKMFLKTCWESIATTGHRMSEADAGRILDGVMTSNLNMIMKVMNERSLTIDAEGLECTRQLLKYALLITMYVYGCPTHVILKLEIVPSESRISESNAGTHGLGGSLPHQKHLHLRQQHQTAQSVTLDRSSATMDVLLKCLGSTTLSIQGEVVKGIATIVEDAARVSNMDMFLDSIHEEFVPCLWDLLSPLNDHLADTTLPLLMRLVSGHPEYFHKIVARSFADQDWEVRFSALDSVFGLFSKLDDGLVLRLFFQSTAPTTFLPEHLQVLGPVFSHFVSSMWDKEHAVRTKAKALLKSLQPVHVSHALKAWELHFVASSPEVQQTLLKLMTRLNNYFPSWKIMDYGVIFRVLTSGGLGRSFESGSTVSLTGHAGASAGSIMGSGSGGPLNAHTGGLTNAASIPDSGPSAEIAGGFGTYRQEQAPTTQPSVHDHSLREELDDGGASFEGEGPSLQRRPSNSSSALLEAVPPMYIPRQRVSPIPGRTLGDDSDDGSGLLNDPGHENFVLTICMNLQLILDRYIDIKPDNERDAPTLYDQMQAREAKEYEGTGYEYGGPATQSDHHTSSPPADRTFSSTSETTAEYGKASSHTSASESQLGDDSDGGEDDRGHHRHRGLFCFPRHKHPQDESHHQQAGDGSGQKSTVSQKNTYHYQHQQHGSRHGQKSSARYQQHPHHHYRRNPNRRYEENAPVVGTYFVDVILRFFGSETDLSVLPAGRLKSWLELLLIVVYKFIKEDDPLSDLVVVLMKRIIEMLMVRRSAPAASTMAGTFTTPAGISNGHTIVSASPIEEESMSEENTLLAISICSTLLKRSSTMTTALLSREIMAMGRLMTKRRDDPEDPVLIRAKTFLHDAFVHFMGNGLFVLVFKTQPTYNFNSFGWEENESKADSDLDLFYVLSTVLGKDEMVPPEPIGNHVNNSFGLSATGTAPGSTTNARLVHIRDQPIRDILDRVMIFRDLEPLQVSTILTNLALYVERVHSKFEDARLIPDMGQFLIKLTKYTADWDQQQQQRQKELAQQLKQAQEQKQQQTHLQLLQQQHQQQALKKRGTYGQFPGNASTMFSNASTVQLPSGPAQKQGVMSVNSGSTIAIADNDPLGMNISPLDSQAQSKAVTTANEESQKIAVSLPFSQTASDLHTLRPTQSQQQQQQQQHQSTPTLKKALYTYHWDYVDPVLNMCSIVMIQNPMEGHHLIAAVKHVLKQALYRDRISAPVMIRLLTGYCYVAELDFSLQLVNVFGEFLVDELKASILNNPKANKSDLDGSEGHHHHHHTYKREAEAMDESQRFHLGRTRQDSRTASLLRGEKEKSVGLSGGGEATLTGTAGVSLGLSGVVGGGGLRLAGGRTKFLASNFHLLHHLLIWDVNPGYNPEWTKIKWGILGSMRFPPGHPILLPGANDALRQETAAIIADWADV